MAGIGPKLHPMFICVLEDYYYYFFFFEKNCLINVKVTNIYLAASIMCHILKKITITCNS